MDQHYVTGSKPLTISLQPSDLTSRYKCVQLQITHTGKNKMLKTVFSNVETVAKLMKVQADQIVKFIGYELNTQCKIEKEIDQSYVSGHYDVSRLSDIMEKFINLFVLCRTCALPEVIYKFSNTKGTIHTNCQACGTINDITNNFNDKFVKYVTKN